MCGALGRLAFAEVAYATADAGTARRDDARRAVIAMMERGNLRFRRGVQQPQVARRDALQCEGGTRSRAALSCIDSRAPAERIMDLGIDIFNARVAGNIANDDILGSLEFACGLAGAKIVVVMGHTACGAIKGAIDNAELGNLTGLLAKIRPAVAATDYTGLREGTSEVRRQGREEERRAHRRRDRARSRLLVELRVKGNLKIVGCDVPTRHRVVDFTRSAGGARRRRRLGVGYRLPNIICRAARRTGPSTCSRENDAAADDNRAGPR